MEASHRPPARRVILIGLDCAPPELVFDRYRSLMPNLAKLMDRGRWARLRSTVPPITVPAWTSMLSGKDPGELGLYGFRSRVPGSYGQRVATAQDVDVPRVWDVAGAAGRRVAVLFVPPTFPPPAVNGELVSCFLTPGTDLPHTYPPALQQELEARFGPYRMDVEHFRSPDPGPVLDQLYAMTSQHFAIARHLWTSRKPDLMTLVEMGPDRFHHALWRYIDPTHPKYPGPSPYQDAGQRYYAYLDQQIGELVALADERTAILVASDHGAQPLQGAVAVNEWLRQEGYLVTDGSVQAPVPLAQADIDWSRTRAWAEGGYYARVFLNLQGREPQGCVPPDRREALRDELAARLEALPGPGGRPLATKALVPEHIYRRVRGQPPDLCVFFDDLAYRAVGSLGHGRIHLEDNDTGPDGCNHAWDGIFVLSGPGVPRDGDRGTYAIYDVGRTVLGLLDLAPAGDWLGCDRSVA